VTVEFVVQTSDLRQATNQLKANRGVYNDSDFVDIEVSENVAIFRAVGTESEAPVEGNGPGSVRVPLRIVDKIAEALTTVRSERLPFHCEKGLIKVGTFSLRHREIKLTKASSLRLSLPINLSTLDTLALSKLLTSRRIFEEGMRARAEQAEYSRRAAIASAVDALKDIEIETRQLDHLVDCHIQQAAGRLRKTLNLPEQS
jgi:hypothetical protein